MATKVYAPKLWRSTFRNERTASTDTIRSSSEDIEDIEDSTFGIKAPIVDFFDHTYITKFAPLKEILDSKVDEIMEKAYKQDLTDESFAPIASGGPKFRWIHIPTNNMIWIEEIIKNVCESKEKVRAKKFRENGQNLNRKVLNAEDILSRRYWKDQQHGYVQHCADHPLYGRYMAPFFAKIPTDWETKTASVAGYLRNSTPVENVSLNQTSITTKSGQDLDTESTSELKQPTATDHNMVLFMPYLDWTTSGRSLDHREALIEEFSNNLRYGFYKRPTREEIAVEENSEMKILRTFLYPLNDCSLHLPRTLDQYYYSALTSANKRTTNQVVYKFAKKQYSKRIEEAVRAKNEEKKRKAIIIERRKYEVSDSFSQRDRSWEGEEMEKKPIEVSWDPPNIMMVSQLWIWIIDGDTVITSFPTKNESGLSAYDRADGGDNVAGDDIYDSTDIWRAVQNELRYQTTDGQRTKKSALDLVWTIADQTRGVFLKRNIPPNLQFIQMFEMEINEIDFKQEEEFATFNTNVLAAHNIKAIGELIEILSTFRKQHIGFSQAQDWKSDFRVMAIDFKSKFNQVTSNILNASTSYVKDSFQQSTWGFPISRFRYIGEDIVHDDDWEMVLTRTFMEMKEKFESAHLIKLSHEDSELLLLESLMARFIDLEGIIRRCPLKTASLDRNLNRFLQPASNFFDWYTQLPTTKNLFEVTIEMNLLARTKDIMHELEIISCVGTQQEAAIKPFIREMLHRSLDGQDSLFHNSISWGNRIKELQRKAQLTYTALQDLLDIKQSQATARAARNDAKASAHQADLATELSLQTIRQGSVIMVFTIVTIIFLPLSFFTSLFGMNAKELNSGNYSMGFYSAIMYPISFVIICLSLILAFKPRLQWLFRLVLKNVMNLTWWLGLCSRLLGTISSVWRRARRFNVRIIRNRR